MHEASNIAFTDTSFIIYYYIDLSSIMSFPVEEDRHHSHQNVPDVQQELDTHAQMVGQPILVLLHRHVGVISDETSE